MRSFPREELSEVKQGQNLQLKLIQIETYSACSKECVFYTVFTVWFD